jgi:hypothetical protein
MTNHEHHDDGLPSIAQYTLTWDKNDCSEDESKRNGLQTIPAKNLCRHFEHLAVCYKHRTALCRYHTISQPIIVELEVTSTSC